MSFLVPLGAIALLCLPAIALLYFLKVRRPEIRVATLMFWRPHVADRQANAPWQRLRPSLLLFLQLLAALLLALGLMRPGLIGAAGIASTTEPANGENPDGENLDPLFDVLLEHIPPPQGDPKAPLQALVTNLDASAFLGRLALIRIYKGRIRKGQQVAWMREVDGHPVITNAKITELLVTEGVERTPTDEAVAGDIVAVAGLPEIMIGDTLADPDHAHALPRITVDELKKKIDSGEELVIVDLRHSMEFEADPETIPGAFRMDAKELQEKNDLLPRDREIILYCT